MRNFFTLGSIDFDLQKVYRQMEHSFHMLDYEKTLTLGVISILVYIHIFRDAMQSTYLYYRLPSENS